jgi:diguanylate cyclase (GGDEF)-like protein/PAS domain S-box-containing protein
MFGFIDGNPIATFVIDSDHHVVSWNRACEVLTGISAADMIGSKEQWRAFYPEERPVMADLIVDGFVEEDVRYFYKERFRPSELIPGGCEAEDFFPTFGGNGRWLFFTAAPIRDKDNKIIGAIETLQDFTERRQAEAALKDKEAYIAQVIQSTSVATVVIDHTHQITHWNKACEALTGLQASDVMVCRDHWRPTDLAGKPFLADLVLEGEIEADFHRFFLGNLRKSSLVDGAFETEVYRENPGGEGKWLYYTAAPLLSREGELIGAIETMQDITERHAAEESLRQSEERYRELSVTDSLTQLFNARHFKSTLDQEMTRAKRYRRPMVLVIADVDNFKLVNDTYGHAEGDRVLEALAEVIRSCLRITDTAYRYGGEEFAILMPEVTAQDGSILAERVRERFAQSPQVMPGGATIHVSISMGVTQFEPGDDAKSIFSRADSGMYQAKLRGKNCLVIAELPTGP